MFLGRISPIHTMHSSANRWRNLKTMKRYPTQSAPYIWNLSAVGGPTAVAPAACCMVPTCTDTGAQTVRRLSEVVLEMERRRAEAVRPEEIRRVLKELENV